jgi:type VI secretion system protein ImpA
MIPLDKLLEPIVPENPCGEFLPQEYGLLETQITPQLEWDGEQEKTREPSWREVRDTALDLCQRSKHLDAGVTLCLALLKLDGLAGFAEGLQLLQGWVDKYWDTLYPLPDEGDQYPRINALNNLSARADVQSPYCFVKFLRQTPLCKPAHVRGCCLRDALLAEEGKGAGEFSTDQVAAAFRDTPAEQLQQTHDTLGGLLKTLEAMEGLVAEKSGAPDSSQGGLSLKFDELKNTLTAMQNTVAGYLGAESPPPGPGGPAGPQGGPPGAPAPGGELRGVVNSRGEAEQALKLVCDYFRRCEPSSPVPLVIERAVRLLRKDFIASLRELAIGSDDEFKKLFGAVPEGGDQAPKEEG